MRTGFILAGLLVAGAIIAWLEFRSPPAELPATPPLNTEAQPNALAQPPALPTASSLASDPAPNTTAVPAPAPEQVILPSLAESDAFIREQVSGWSIPQIWLSRDQLMSRLAVVVQNAAAGKIPKRQLGFMAPQGNFQVRKVGEQIFVDPKSYARYDSYVAVLTAIPPQQLADFLHQIEPLIADGLALLGDRREPKKLIRAALQQVLQLPVLPADVELKQPKVLYVYADEALERRSDFAKQLLRMGPDNVQSLQSYVVDLAKYY